MSMTREICKICYRPVTVGFKVPDYIWEKVVPEPLRNKCLCLQCFTTLADEHFIRWDKDIEFFPVSLISLYEFNKKDL